MTTSTQRYLDLVTGRSRGVFPTLARGGLWLASGPYGVAVRLRNLAFDRGWWRGTKVTVPVVSIGNLTLGGLRNNWEAFWKACGVPG